MKILVTGGAGFIGSHLVEALLAQGHAVTVLDDFSTGKAENLPVGASALTVIEGDVANPAALQRALADQEALAHLAAIASVEASVRDPIGTHRTNLEASIRLFDAAAQRGVRRVVYASSAAVYGNNPATPLAESAEKRPLTPYAADKLAGEHYLAYYHRGGKLEATAFRFFNVFGPRQDPSSPYSGVISIFLDRASKGVPITVFGDGYQTRDFVYVEDVVRALTGALTQDRAAQSEMPVFNIGRGVQVSLRDLLDLIARLPGVVEPEVSYAAPREGDIRLSLADVSALNATGWRPLTSIESGLRATLEDALNRD